MTRRPIVFKAPPVPHRLPWVVAMPFGHQSFHRTWAEAVETALMVADEIRRGEVPC